MTSALEETLGSAGAAFVPRRRGLVAAHFGSVAGEIAVCRDAVGLADRSELGKLELRGEPGALQQVALQATGERLAPGRAVLAGGAWWCPVTRHRALVLADEPLADPAAAVAGASAIDLSDDYAAIALVGPRAEAVARAAGLVGRVAPEGGFWPRAGGVSPSLVLREDDRRFLLLVPRGRARAAWELLLDAGRPYGAACVGRAALDLLRAVPVRS